MGKKRRSKEFKNNSQVIDMEEARRQRLEKRQAEKRREEEKIKYAASQRTRGKMAIRKSRNRRRFLIGLIAVCITGMITFSLLNVVSLKKEKAEVIRQSQELQQEKEQLEKELSEINDPANIEQQARDQLRLIKPGEKLYMFPEEITETRVVEEEQAAGESTNE